MAYYCLDEHGNKVETYTAQEVLSILEQAIEGQSLAGITADSGFIEQIKCCVSGITHKIAFVTQATYNELRTNNQIISGAWYFIIDDTTGEDMAAAIAQLQTTVATIQTSIDTINTEMGELTLASLSPFLSINNGNRMTVQFHYDTTEQSVSGSLTFQGENVTIKKIEVRQTAGDPDAIVTVNFTPSLATNTATMTISYTGTYESHFIGTMTYQISATDIFGKTRTLYLDVVIYE